jgi:hypothetical protein
MFDDASVREVGRSWMEAAQMCLACKFQPVAIFYETFPGFKDLDPKEYLGAALP